MDLGRSAPEVGSRQQLTPSQDELRRKLRNAPCTHMLTHAQAHIQEHSPGHGDDGDEVSLAMVGDKPDAREAFKLSKCLQDNLAAGIIWRKDTLAESLARPPELSCPEPLREGERGHI